MFIVLDVDMEVIWNMPYNGLVGYKENQLEKFAPRVVVINAIDFAQ